MVNAPKMEDDLVIRQTNIAIPIDVSAAAIANKPKYPPITTPQSKSPRFAKDSG